MKFLGTLLFLLLALSLSGQEDGRYTEEEVAFQQEFIAARQFMLIERYEKALEEFEKLYKKNRKSGAVCFELARLCAIQGKEDDAEKYAANAIKIAPENEWYQVFYANLMMERKFYQKAIGSLQYLNNHYPDNPDYYDQLAFAYLSNQEFDKAIFVLTNQETRLGNSDSVIMKKFEVFHKSGKTQEAINELLRLKQRNPENTDVLNRLAAYYSDHNMVNEANLTYELILKIDPNDTRANVAILGDPDNPEDQNVYLRTLIPLIQNNQIPIDAKLNELIPYVEKLADHYDAELASSLDDVTRNLILIHPEDAKAFAIRGDVLMLGRNIEGAIDIYKKTLERNDRVFAVWEQLMYALDWQNDHMELKKVSMDAIDLFPNQALSYLFNASANIGLGNFDEASEILQEVTIISGRNVNLKSQIAAVNGRLHYEKGDLDKAEEIIKKALELSENQNSDALETMGDIHFKNGDKTKALKYWEDSLKLGNQSNLLLQKIEQKQIIE